MGRWRQGPSAHASLPAGAGHLPSCGVNHRRACCPLQESSLGSQLSPRRALGDRPPFEPGLHLTTLPHLSSLREALNTGSRDPVRSDEHTVGRSSGQCRWGEWRAGIAGGNMPGGDESTHVCVHTQPNRSCPEVAVVRGSWVRSLHTSSLSLLSAGSTQAPIPQ